MTLDPSICGYTGGPDYERLLELESEIKRLKNLLTYAALKFELVTWKLDFVDKSTWAAYEIPEMIAELRKAAE